MGWHLDGRAGAVVGTHTHVPTADAECCRGGTAYISDVGMTGSRASVLGVRWEQALEGFRTQMGVRFTTAEEDVWVNAVLVEIGPTVSRARSSRCSSGFPTEPRSGDGRRGRLGDRRGHPPSGAGRGAAAARATSRPGRNQGM